MTWARLDDGLWRNRKIRKVWHECPQALGLHLLALSYCADQLTDGVVDREFVDEQLAPYRLRKTRERITRALRDNGLWSASPTGFEINDWLEYNPSRDDVLAERAANAARKAEWRARRHGGTDTGTDGGTNAGVPGAPYPYPYPTYKERDQAEKERQPSGVRHPSRRMGGPTHDEANAAADSWAARKRERDEDTK